MAYTAVCASTLNGYLLSSGVDAGADMDGLKIIRLTYEIHSHVQKSKDSYISVPSNPRFRSATAPMVSSRDPSQIICLNCRPSIISNYIYVSL